MKPSLQIRLSQHLALTPQLQQSIRLLQLSTLELHQEVGQMLDQNPFLEMDEDAAVNPFEVPAEHQAVDRPVDAQADRVAAADQADAPSAADGLSELKAEDFGTTGQDEWENGTEKEDFDGIRETPSLGSGAAADEDGERPERGGPAISLQDHLRLQTAGMRLSDDDRGALDILIESLNDNGYLADSLADITQSVADMLGLVDADSRESLLERLQCALKWLQSLEPTGVGARDLQECLALQLESHAATPARAVAQRICADHLDLLARRDVRRIAALTCSDEATVRQAHELIKTCEPKPGGRLLLTSARWWCPTSSCARVGARSASSSTPT